ncbi:MAG: fimbrillin family protein [Bacteroidales bacterium]
MKKTLFYLGLSLLFTACSSNDLDGIDTGTKKQTELIVHAGIQQLNTQRNLSSKTISPDILHKGPIMTEYYPGNAELGLILLNYKQGGSYPGVQGEIWGNLKCRQNGLNWDLEQIFHLNTIESRIFAYYPYDESLGKSIIGGSKDFAETKIPVKPGYTDYMMGDGVSECFPTASNPIGNLIMYHSLSMISFTFQKKEMFNNNDWSRVQSITIRNIWKDGYRGTSNHSAKPMSGSDKCQLRIARFLNNKYLPEDVENTLLPTAEWAEWTGDECKFGSNKIGESVISGENATAPLFHALVIPQDGLSQSVTGNAPTAVIRIDDVDYTIPLYIANPSAGNNNTTWSNGKHYVYNLTYNNKVLSVASVTVNQWQEGGSSDIEI